MGAGAMASVASVMVSPCFPASRIAHSRGFLASRLGREQHASICCIPSRLRPIYIKWERGAAMLLSSAPKPVIALDIQGRCGACEVRDLSICSALSAAELARLRSISCSRHAAPEETVIEESDPATDLYNVVRGTVKLYKLLPDGRRQVTGFLYPGDFLGIALNDV